MMRFRVDTETRSLMFDNGKQLDLYGKEAFELVSDLWLKLSWGQKYSYTFTWMGRPIIQHPEDMVRLQEVIYRVKPDVIVETGVAHGGSLVYFASMFKAMGVGRKIIGVDVEVREHNRRAIDAHELRPYLEIVVGDSAAPSIVKQVESHIRPGDTVLVMLDSNHSRAHVAAELEAYKHLVSLGSYIVATDGIMRDVWDTPRGTRDWATDNPAAAAEAFVKVNRNFAIEAPSWEFNESALTQNITAWPQAWLRRVA